jgi:hypothetical protein
MVGTLLNVNAENYGGTALDAHQYDAESYIYFFVGSALPTAVSSFGYIQLMVLDPSFISANRVFNEA